MQASQTRHENKFVIPQNVWVSPLLPVFVLVFANLGKSNLGKYRLALGYPTARQCQGLAITLGRETTPSSHLEYVYCEG